MTMKRKTAILPLALAAALTLVFASAAGGDAGDPLISLDYLTGVFLPAAETAVQDRADAAGQAVYDAAEAKWHAALSAEAIGQASEHTDVWAERRMKRGDLLAGTTGTQVLLLAGGAEAHFSAGTVVDVTDGTELVSGTALKARHRYLVAEDTGAAFAVTSPTAVLDYCGAYHVTESADTPDRNAMAAALRELSLFRGTDTGFGEGFDLEAAPNRVQALVMLIRLLGEEDAALACASPSPFKDISETYWGKPYIAYAYEKGYTNGVEGNKFAPGRTASEGMYVEFVLRALGYSDTTQTDVSTAAERALAAGVITEGELAALRESEFLRADVVYLSWYALDVPLNGETQTLRQKLVSAGVFTDGDYRRADALVTSARL